MAVGCGPKLAKIVLFVFNALFWISGVILIIVGAYFLANGSFKYIDQFINSSTNKNILIAFVVVGSIIFLIGFCGCCGALKESRCLLGLYIIFVLVIVSAEVVFGILIIINKDYARNQFVISFNETVQTKYGSPGPTNTTDQTIVGMVDGLQQFFKCCGAKKYTEWKDSRWYSLNSDKSQVVPPSCCIKDDNCWNNINSDTTYLDGCVYLIDNYIQRNLPVVIGVTLGIAFFEIFVVICAVCLCRHTGTQPHAV